MTAQSQVFQLALTLPRGKESEVAAHCLAACSQSEWESVAAFALAVVLLAERVSAIRVEIEGKSLPASPELVAALLRRPS